MSDSFRFYAKTCAILQAVTQISRWPRQHQQVGHYSSLLLLSDSDFLLNTLSSPPCFFLLQSHRNLWQEVSSFCFFTMRPPRVPGHLFLPGNDKNDELARQGSLLLPSAVPCCPLPLTFVSTLLVSWSVSSKFLYRRVSSVFTEKLVLPRQTR